MLTSVNTIQAYLILRILQKVAKVPSITSGANPRILLCDAPSGICTQNLIPYSTQQRSSVGKVPAIKILGPGSNPGAEPMSSAVRKGAYCEPEVESLTDTGDTFVTHYAIIVEKERDDVTRSPARPQPPRNSPSVSHLTSYAH